MLFFLGDTDSGDSEIPIALKIFYQEISSREKRFRKFFKDPECIEQYLGASLSNGSMELPGLLGDDPAVCVGSYFSNYNFLLFRQVDSGKFFYVLQHNNGCSGFYFPDKRLLSAPGSIVGYYKKGSNSEKLERELVEHLGFSKDSYNAKLLGFLDGYSRPYHYFYDRLPSLLELKKIFPCVRVFSLSSSFYPGLFLSKPDAVDKDCLNKIAQEKNGFFYQPFRFSDVSHDKLALPVVEKALENDGVLYLNKNLRKSFFIWIGLCQEKRNWEGKQRAIIDIINLAKSLFSDPVFVFDGMTCSASEKRSDFREKFCQKDIDLLRCILEKAGDISYIDLIGAKSETKITISQFSDFFFSSALTDSMWPAHFGRSKGVAYAANVANINVHSHPLTYIVPKEYVEDADDGIDNWAGKGYEINFHALSYFVEGGLMFCRDLKNKINDYGVFGGKTPDCISFEKNHGVEKIVVKVDGCDSAFLPLYGQALEFDEHQSFSVVAKAYSFKSSFWCEGEVEFIPNLVFYSSSGGEVDRKVLEDGIDFLCEVKEEAKYYRVFANIKGRGVVIYNGFYAQPIFDF